jgi:hypothetical protein
MIEKRQRVITTGKGAAEMGLKEPMKGILISSKAGNVYILRDGKKTIEVYKEDQWRVDDDPDTPDRIEHLMLGYLMAYYKVQASDGSFDPVLNSKLRCISYLIDNMDYIKAKAEQYVIKGVPSPAGGMICGTGIAGVTSHGGMTLGLGDAEEPA